MNDHTKMMLEQPHVSDLSGARNVRVVAVGDPASWRESCGRVPSYRDLSFCGIDDIDEGLIYVTRPNVIVSPVVTLQFDCLDLAVRLASFEFRGAYRALSRNLPRPGMICREVQAFCPGLDFDIIPIQSDNRWAI